MAACSTEAPNHVVQRLHSPHLVELTNGAVTSPNTPGIYLPNGLSKALVVSSLLTVMKSVFGCGFHLYVRMFALPFAVSLCETDYVH